MNVIIRCDAGLEIGLGHYIRCSLLKKTLERNGVSAFLALKCQENGTARFEADIMVETECSKEVNTYNFKSKNMLLDILHYKNSNQGKLRSYLSDLKHANNKIALIEGLEDDACPSSLYPFLDALFTPYIQIKNAKQISNHFFGKGFILLDPARILANKNIRKLGNRVLLTFGGSDPWDQTLQVLRDLREDKRSINLALMVVIGPLMSQARLNNILGYQDYFKMQIVRSPENLVQCFNWADVAITNTGQTRYELAASGVPFIILPFDQGGYHKSSIFQDLGAAVIGWPHSTLKESSYIEKIFKLLSCENARLKMSVNGRKNFFNKTSADNFSKTLMEIYK